jgi:tetratricopeptide (TPR) repeat protein/transcriptional regulator with XRE-family HTH domain
MKANQRLRRERELRGWSQARVAGEIGTDPATVSRWERGLSFPYPYFREKLCALFEKNAEELGLVQDESAGGPAQRHYMPTHERAGAPLFVEPLHDPSIPLPSTVGPGLVGRDDMLSWLKQRLCTGDSVGLTALNGLPGVGKTALAVQLAHDKEVLDHFSDGVLWAALGPRPNVVAQLSRWGVLLGIASSEPLATDSPEAWAAAIRSAIGMRRMLLVIDDAWELEEALAFKAGGPNCAFLVTTRFPHIALHFAADATAVVHELDENDGIALLERLVPGLEEIDPRAAPQLVHAAGGLPLALTLMGKYLRVQAHSRQPRRIRAAIERLLDARERLQLSEPYAPVERHPSLSQNAPLSLRSVIAVSDLLLDVPAQEALRALAVFPAKPNSFSEDAAVAVCNQPRETLDRLTDAGLLESHGPGRYMLHQSIADYALLHLDDSAPYQRMVAHFVDYVSTYARDYNILEQESDNILAALQIAFERGMQAELVRGVNAFSHFLLARALYSLAEQHLERAYQAARTLNNPQAIVTTLLHLGRTAEWQGNYTRAETYLQEGLSLAQQIDDREQIAAALHELGEVAYRSQNNARAELYYQEGLRLARKLGYRELLCRLLASLGKMAKIRGDYAQAEAYLQEGLSLARQIRQHEVLVPLLTNLGTVELEQGRSTCGEAHLQEALPLAQKLGYRSQISWLLVNLGAALGERGDYDQSIAYLQEGMACAHQIGYMRMVCLALVNLACVARERGDYNQAEAYLQEGLACARGRNDAWYISHMLGEWGEVHLKQERIEEAIAAFREALANAPQGDQELRTLCQYGLARAAAAQGNLAEARYLGEACLSFFESCGHRYAPQAREWLRTLPCDR